MVGSLLLALVIGYPATPVPLDPPDGGWAKLNPWFAVSDYSDDAGIAQRALVLQYRSEPGSYGGAGLEVLPQGQYRWRLRGTDALGNVGAFSGYSAAVTVSDQGVVDAGTGQDAGPEADGGLEPDGGLDPDGGTGAGLGRLNLTVGCGCRSTDGSQVAWLAALLVFAAHRRRARARVLSSTPP